MKTVVVCSGGMDSVTLSYHVTKDRELGRLISFDYGQHHRKELNFAAITATDLGVPHTIIDIANVGRLLGGSALTDNIDVPDGHYAEESMRVTVVPNRNAIMLTIAFEVAAADNASAVAAAVHAGDHFIYPDCRPAFIETFAQMQACALEGMWKIELFTPYVHQAKADIARKGLELGVPFAKTWSCYKSSDIHCGRCGTCVERQEAMHIAGAIDPTEYEDPYYWREASKAAP